MQNVAAPRPVGTRLCPSGQRGSRRGWWAGRGGPLLRPVFSSDPAAEGEEASSGNPSQRLVAPHSPECGKGSNEVRIRGFPDALMLPAIDDHRMWLVTTEGDLPDDYEQREHDASIGAWDDYAGRILELEIYGTGCLRRPPQPPPRPASYTPTSRSAGAPSRPPVRHRLDRGEL